MRPAVSLRARQRGAAIMVILLVLGVAAAYFALSALNRGAAAERSNLGTTALAQGRDALIGFAATYRDAHPSPGPTYDQPPGFLPCPDGTNDGQADPPCLGTDIAVIGRLPWRTLQIPPARDGSGECLWYAVSGLAKDNPQTTAFNWDTPGQFIVRDASGRTLAGATAHDRPHAVLLAPGKAIAAQTRPGTGAAECDGSNVATAYLEGSALATGAGAVSTLTLATEASQANGSNNDRAHWITARDIFDRVKVRSDFASDISQWLDALKTCLDALGTLPAVSGSKGTGNINTACPLSPTKIANFHTHWQDNLLYARPGGALTVNGATCDAVLIFGGERSGTQTRSTSAERDSASNYLEGGNATLFPNAGAYTGAPGFSKTAPSADVVRCIVSGSAPATNVSFASDFSGFVPAGVGVSTDTSVPADPKLNVNAATGASGGCFWWPNTIPLAGKVIRAYYRYQYQFADPVGGADRGNGFTLQLVRGDLPSPSGVCGRQQDMGALTLGVAPGDVWGMYSFIFESDVYQDNSLGDPSENHTAILANGSLQHPVLPTAACDGSSHGCRHSPANKGEESPTPLLVHQRIEIRSGCNNGCGTCTSPVAHAAPNNYVRVRTWADCTLPGCTTLTSDLASPPSAQLCQPLNAALNTAYLAFTGGFRSGGANEQGVTVSGFTLRSE